MIDLPKENDYTHNGKDKFDDNTGSMKDSYLNGSETYQSGRRRKCLEPGEEGSRCIILNNPEIRERNPNHQANMAKHRETDAPIVSHIFQPQHGNQRHERDLMPKLYSGMKFTGVIDGAIPGGYLVNISVGNGVSLQGKAFFSFHTITQIEEGANVIVPWVCPANVDHTQNNHSQNLSQEKEMDHLRNTRNQESCGSFGINKTPLEFEIDDDFYTDYSDIEMPPSPEIHVPDPLLVTNKFAPVVLKQVNPLTGVPIDPTKSLDKGKKIIKDYNTPNPKDYRICIDPFLPRKFPSPAISISPPCDDVRKKNVSTEILVTEQYATLSQPGSLSLNQNTSQHVLLKNNEKNVQCQPADIRKRNVSTGISVIEQYARLSQTGSSSLNKNTSQHALLKNNEKIVQYQPGDVRKRNVSTEILITEQYPRLSQSGSSSLNRNTFQHALLKNNEKVVQCQSTGVRKRNISSEVLVAEQYPRLSQPGSTSLNQNKFQHAFLKNNEKVVQCQPSGVRKRNISSEILVTKQYSRLSQSGSSSLSQNTLQHALLKNNEKVVQCQLFGVRKRNVSTEILVTEQYPRFSRSDQHVLLKDNERVVQCQPTSSNLTDMVNSIFETNHQNRLMRKQCEKDFRIEKQEDKIFIDLDDDDDDDDDEPNSTS